MYTKNMNQVEMDITCWIIVHTHTGIIPFISLMSKLAGLSNPYFCLLHLLLVYIMKKSNETSSARLDPIAAPVIPKAGSPKCPNINIQLNSIFDETMTIELSVNVLVCVVPT